MSFSEGRIRPITAVNTSNINDAVYKTSLLTLPGSKKGSIDYFITDHRSDVRMILTEETQWSYTTASMETANNRRGVEVNLFGDGVQNTELDINLIPGQTSGNGWTANTSAFVARLSNATHKVGPNQLLKVMAGDLVTTNVQYYYKNSVVNQSGSTVFNSVLTMLGSTIIGSNATSLVTKNAASAITGNLNAGIAFSQLIAPDIISPNGQLAKAYLNVVFFDERFTFVQDGSTSTRVGNAGVAATIALLNIKVPKNGYCLVYISNESDEPVYFDNFQVRHDRGRIIEENHYYAYGLKIAALSSKAFGGAQNNYQYQGDYSEFDDDLGWNDFALRSYDPQIGRFIQNDPYDQFASGYVGMGNDPVNMVDPTGGFGGGIGAVATSATAGAQQAGVGYNAVVTFKRVVTTTTSTVQTVSSISSVANSLVKGGGLLSDATSVKLPGGPPNSYKSNQPSIGPDNGNHNRPLWYEIVNYGLNGNSGGSMGLSLLENNPATGPGMEVLKGGIQLLNDVKSTYIGFKDDDGQNRDLLGRTISNTQREDAVFRLSITAFTSVLGPIFRMAAVPVGATKTGTQAESKVFLVTKEGVVLPKGAKIPSEFVENPFRSSNYGIIENGKFVEKLRIDPATPAGMKGPNFSHYHLNGSGKHLTGNWPWW